MLRLTAAFFVLVSLFGGVLRADTPEPFPDFSFKRVKPPSSNGPRIKVQIAPRAEPAVPEGATPETEAQPSAFAWFWTEVSPDIGNAQSDRLAKAMSTVQDGAANGQINAPRLDEMQTITDAYGTAILRATVGTNVSPALVAAMIYVESGGKPEAVSKAGAEGLMQLMPVTAERFNVEDSLDPLQNITGGVAFLNVLLTVFDRDPVFVLAAYNAGENAVKQSGGVPAFEETRGYVPKAIAAWSVARGLCQTPPELFTDGCVFVKGVAG